jgi:hypothetical protein
MIPAHIGILAEVRDDTCETKVGGVWTLITIEEALGLHSDRKTRCPACHGRVKVFHDSTNDTRAHFEHYVAHPGCPRGDSYSGTPSPHPEPL